MTVMIDKIESKLKEQGYEARNAALLAPELMKAEPCLLPLVEDWLNGKEPDFEAKGYNIYSLMKSRRMTYPAALLTIDWLIKEPEKAVESLKRGIR